MPGPGGGGRGGGFGGGGFGGGGHGFGGGFHGGGGPHFHHHGPRFFFFRPWGYGYGYGSGCLGGFVGALMLPIILFVTVATVLSFTLSSAITAVGAGGRVEYNEREFQDFAAKEYAAAFHPVSEDYEDNLLIVFLTNENPGKKNSYGYYCIAYIGDNVIYEVNELFGNEYTEFGQTVLSCVPQFYENSLSANLGTVLRRMATEVKREIGYAGEEDAFYESYERTPYAPFLSNTSNLSLNEKTVKEAMTYFTEETEIPVAVSVSTAEKVFGREAPVMDFILVAVLGVTAIGAIWMLVKTVKRRKEKKENPYIPKV